MVSGSPLTKRQQAQARKAADKEKAEAKRAMARKAGQEKAVALKAAREEAAKEKARKVATAKLEAAAKAEESAAAKAKAAPEPLPTGGMLSVVVDSAPGGTVYLGRKKLGPTPYTVTWKAGERPPRVRVKRRGYEARGIRLGADDAGKTKKIRLLKEIYLP